MSDLEILNKFREDLTAAGFKPLEYFNATSMGLAKWGDCSACGESCYFCPSCENPYHLDHLRQAEDGTWSCLECLGRKREMTFDEGRLRTDDPR